MHFYLITKVTDLGTPALEHSPTRVVYDIRNDSLFRDSPDIAPLENLTIGHESYVKIQDFHYRVHRLPDFKVGETYYDVAMRQHIKITNGNCVLDHRPGSFIPHHCVYVPTEGQMNAVDYIPPHEDVIEHTWLVRPQIVRVNPANLRVSPEPKYKLALSKYQTLTID